MSFINLFPLTISKDKIIIEEDSRKEMILEINKMISNSKNQDYQNNDAAWTGDTQGFEYLHKNEKFKNLFKNIKVKILEYVGHLNINPDTIDLYITRSWATLSKGKERVDRHAHFQSHISFAYYLKKNEKDSNIVFFDESYHNEIIPGLFRSRTVQTKGILKGFTLNTAPSIDIDVKEDDIVIFPSKRMHATKPNQNNNDRISISGDVICVAKDTNLLETMMPPLENWDKMK